MKVIPVQSLKGGTGKTQICVGLGRALKGLGCKVGFLDLDWVAPNLHLHLGLPSDMEVQLSDGVGDRIKPVVSPEGFPILSSTFIFPSDQAISMDEESKINDIREVISNGVVDWGKLDYLIMDTPPTTSKFISAALSIPGLFGVVLVVQPAISAITDLIRTVSLIREQHVPVLGLIANQVYLRCPHDGQKINLYDLTEDDVRWLCTQRHIPYLGAVPHMLPTYKGQVALEKSALASIAAQLETAEPCLLPEQLFSKIPYKLLMALAKRRQQSKKPQGEKVEQD